MAGEPGKGCEILSGGWHQANFQTVIADPERGYVRNKVETTVKPHGMPGPGRWRGGTAGKRHPARTCFYPVNVDVENPLGDGFHASFLGLPIPGCR